MSNVFVGNSAEFLDKINERVAINENRLKVLAPLVKEPGYDEEHRVLSWESQGHAKPVVDETTNWNRIEIIRTPKKVPTDIYGAVAEIGYNQRRWKAMQDQTPVIDLATAALNLSLYNKMLANLLNGDGSPDGAVNLKNGLLTQSGASTEDINLTTATTRELVDAIINSKNKAIANGTRNAAGFRVLLPLSLENKINDFINAAGTMTGRQYLEQAYGMEVIVSELVNRPMLYQTASGDLYYQVYDKIDLEVQSVDSKSGTMSIFGSFASAGLVVPEPKRIVYLKNVAP